MNLLWGDAMYSVVLCDDDEIILEGLSEFIQQEIPDVCLAASASNGVSCKASLHEIKPDILITDIRLPDCLGFDLIECAYEVNENTSIIIISGYDDFKYAQKALKSGALGYISKPIDLDEFTSILNAAKEKCSQNKKNDLLNRRMFLSDILDFKLTDAGEINAKAHSLNLDQDILHAIVIAELDTDSFHFKQYGLHRQQQAFHDFSKTAEQYPSDNFFLLRHTMQQYVFLVHAPDRDALELKIRAYHSGVQACLKESSAAAVTITYGRFISSLSNLRQSYMEALAAMDYKFIIGTSECISYKDIRTLAAPAVSEPQNPGLLQMADISINSRDQLNSQLFKLYHELISCGPDSRSYAQILLKQMAVSLSKEIQQYDIALTDIFSSPMTELESMLQAGSLNLMLNKFRSIYETVADFIEHQQHNKYAKTINNAIRYIQDNLSKPGLNVNDVARHIYLSPGYFSLIFKKQTGETFSDYLIRLRIDKARELIRQSNLRFFEISTMVGYENVSHFNVIFKKYTGLTPSQYRKQNT